MARLREMFRRHRRTGAWAGVLFACLALCGTAALLELQRRRAADADAEVHAQFDGLWHLVMQCNWSPIADVEAALNGGRPLTLVWTDDRFAAVSSTSIFDDYWMAPASARMPLVTTRPASGPTTGPSNAAASYRAELPGEAIGPRYAGWRLHLRFINGRLRGAYAIAPPHVPYAGPSVAWQAIRVTIQFVLWTSVAIWVGCVLILRANRYWRRQIAQVALAALLLAGTAVATTPRTMTPVPGWLPARVARRLPVTYLVACVLTLLAIAVPVRRRRWPGGGPDAPQDPCARCGYDLTGNESGVCPECGTITPRGLINRWGDEAERIEHIGDAPANAGAFQPARQESPKSEAQGDDMITDDVKPARRLESGAR